MSEFILFSKIHIIIMCLGVLGSILLLLLSAFFNKKTYAKIIAIIVLIIKGSELYIRYYQNGESLVSLLPLHLCNITLILFILMFIFEIRFLFQLCFFWGIGALFAILTPEIVGDISNYENISFFITHFFILYSMFYAYLCLDYRPTIQGYIFAFIFLNIICLCVYFVNEHLGTNYLYINRLPEFNSPLKYFGEWPYYIIVVELIYLIITYFLYIPFKQKNVKFGKSIYY